ncbi:hypothetical protein PoHVEF18_010586 [Penicillium ochrochloron]
MSTQVSSDSSTAFQAPVLALEMAKEHIPKAQLEEILSSFLREIGFRFPDWDFDFSLEGPVMGHFQKMPWPVPQREKAIKMAKWISTGVGMCYPFASQASRISFGIHSTYLLLLDDIGAEMPASMGRFAVNLALGKPQESPVLQSFAEWLGYGDAYMGPFANAMNIKCGIEFIHGCVFENAFNGKIRMPVGATNFPGYFRAKTGFTEPYAFFCYPEDLYPEAQYLHIYLPAMQDLCEYISYCNDILSFYKESAVGDERLNYVYNYASAHGIGLTEALKTICSNVVRNIKNIRKILVDHPDVLRDTEIFIQGYAAWYLLQKRYHLSDLALQY